jgi:hypothetical protein
MIAHIHLALHRELTLLQTSLASNHPDLPLRAQLKAVKVALAITARIRLLLVEGNDLLARQLSYELTPALPGLAELEERDAPAKTDGP